MALSSSYSPKKKAANDGQDTWPQEDQQRLLSEIRDMLNQRAERMKEALETQSKQTSQMVEFAFRDFCRRKDDEIAQLSSENERLLLQLHSGHGPNAGTGESPVRPTSKHTQKAWSRDGEQRHAPLTPNRPSPPLRVDSYDDIEGNANQKESAHSISLTQFVTEVQTLEANRDSERSGSDYQSMFGGSPVRNTVLSRMSSDSELPPDNKSERDRKVTIRSADSQIESRIVASGTSSQEKNKFKSQRMSRARFDRNVSQGPHAANKHAVFIDAAAMKEKVKQAVMKKEYNVCDFYKTEGIFQSIARSSTFEFITLSIIAFNALWIAADADYNTAPTLIGAHWVFVVAENFFTFYFSAELAIRFLAVDPKENWFPYNCLRDHWFVFDACLVIMMILENWVATILIVATGNSNNAGSLSDASILKVVRMVRIARMARMIRLLRALPELMILIKGVLVATRSVFFTLCLLAVIIYVFAVGFTELTKGYEPLHTEYFDSVPASMSTLLLSGVLPDLADLVRTIGKANYAYALVMLFFILLSSLTVMNMLVGVLVEVVSVVSKVEKEHVAFCFVKSMLLSMLEELGVADEEDFTISQQEFEQLLAKEEACRIINDVGVDVVGLVDFSDYIFQDDARLTFPEFMDVVLQLRGTNTATVRDVVDLRKFLLNQFNDLEVKLTDTVSQYFEMLKREGLTSSQSVRPRGQSEKLSVVKEIWPTLKNRGTANFLDASQSYMRSAGSSGSRTGMVVSRSPPQVESYEDNPDPCFLPMPTFSDTWVQEV